MLSLPTTFSNNFSGGVGSNDTPPIGAITHNVIPTLFVGAGKSTSDPPLYPELNMSDPKAAVLYTYVPCFTFVPGSEVPRSRIQLGNESFHDNHKDMIPVSSTLNGMFKLSDSNDLERLSSMIEFAGFAEYDIPVDSRKAHTANKYNVVCASGKRTVLNTGTNVLPRGSLVFWRLPNVYGKRVERSGAHLDDKFPENVAVLMLEPFRPDEHLANARLIAKAYRQQVSRDRSTPNAHTESGWVAVKHESQKLIEALSKIFYLFLANGAPEGKNEALSKIFYLFLANGAPEGKNAVEILSQLLLEKKPNPEILTPQNIALSKKVLHGDKIDSFGMESSKTAAEVFRHQILKEVIGAVTNINEIYTSRIIGRNLSGETSPGNTFDILLRVGHGGSL